MKPRDAVLYVSLSLLLAARVAADDSGAEPPKPEGDKVRLALTPTEGQRYAMEVKSHMDMAFMGMETQMDIEQFVVTAVEGLGADGSFTMRNKIARVKGKLSNPMMGETEFDSDKPAQDEDDAGDPMAMAKKQMTKALVQSAGKEVVMKMGRDGAPLGVDGGPPGSDQLIRTLSGLGKLPDKPVGVGDSWTNEADTAIQNFRMKVKMTNTVKAIDADTITVEQKGKMEMAGSGAASDKADPQSQMLASMKTKDSSIKATTKVSRKEGLPLSGDVEMSLELSMNPGSKDEAQGVEMTMKMTTHSERKPAPAEKPAAERKPDATAPKDGEGEKPPVPPAPDEKK